MRKTILPLLLALAVFLTGNLLYADDFESVLTSALKKIDTGTKKTIVISFGNFTYGDKEMGSDFSRYLESNLETAAKKSGKFELFAKNKLEEILETQEMNVSDLFSQQDGIKLGNLKNIKALLYGNFYDAGLNVEIYLNLASIETGTSIDTAKITLKKSLIPREISLLPANYNDAVAVLEKLKDVDKSADGNLKLEAWINRGNGGTYIDGEELVIHFYASDDCYIKIYHIDVKGDLKLIFPNQYHSDNKLKKRKLYSIPDESYGFGFHLEAPYGTEFIKVLASTQQFKDVEEAFVSLGTNSAELVERGLSVKQREAKITEALLNYTILGK
ncbi:MAG: DUF4384 domain-containing protein [Spirochaetales bacterium]|nr:DUF4384 domain-containing protein [Spirochaetales bacterium]